MKRSLRPLPPSLALSGLALIALLAVPACAVSEPGIAQTTQQTAEAQLGSGGVTVDMAVPSDWGSGYCANVTITNGGTSGVTTWQVVIDLNHSTLSQLWNGTSAVAGSQLTVTPTGWNAAIPAGGAQSFGFCGTSTGTPYQPTLVSLTTNGGTTTPPGSGGATVGSGGAVGSGGSGGKASGGATGQGGATGGKPGSGGVSASGGISASGGVSASGGKPGSGGVTASGGKPGSGGVSASGGSSGSGNGSGSAGPNDTVIALNSPRQKMDGFGAADVWMGALTDAQADLFFDVNKGIGLSILRQGIDSTGASLSQWQNAKKAAARGAIVWAAPWSPPANCKDNNNINNGGHLLTSCYDSWATTLASFAAKMQQNAGVPLYGISAQNEPDFIASYSSCIFTGAQMVAFVKVLGPKLAALNPPVKLIAAEPDVWTDLWGSSNNYGNAILNDAAASTAVSIFATHQYGNGLVAAPPASNTKPIWETEASGVPGSAQAGPSSDITNGLAVAKWVHDAIATGNASAWHYWWLISLDGDNEGLLLQGGGLTKRLYTVGNFSKFVRPGAQRVSLTGVTPAGVSLTAYRNSDGTIAVVALNAGGSAVSASFFISGGTAPSSFTPWVTSASDDLASKTALAVSGGRFTATLGAQTVTTFVGKP